MSGSHQFYTATGRALPLPPKRTPSRHSTVLRLPTRRAEETRSTTVRADSPGRVEAPHGGEFRNIPESVRAASQMVVYDSTAAAAAAARAERTAKRAAAAPSQTSSVARGSRRSSVVAAASATAAVAKARPPPPPSSSASTHASPTPSVPVASPSQSESVVSSRAHVHQQHKRGVHDREETYDSVPVTPTPKSTRLSAGGDTASDTSSPCLNRMLPPQREGDMDGHDGDYAKEHRRGVLPESASEVQSIPMSSARQSHSPENQKGLHNGSHHHDHHCDSRSNSTYTEDRSVSRRSSQSQYGSRRERPAVHDVPHEREAAPHSGQLRPPPRRRHTAAAAAAADQQLSSAPSSYRAGPPSAGYSESEVSAYRPPAAAAAAAATRAHVGGPGNNRGAAAPAHDISVEPRTASAATSTSQHHNHSLQQQQPQHLNSSNRSGHKDSNTSAHHHHPQPADRHDHLYSQRKIEERRASRPAGEEEAVPAIAYRPPGGSEQLALVPAPAVVRYSTRSPRNEDDPLEMNTPIADRLRQRSVVEASRLAYAVEGTELMPSLPRLQGRRANRSDVEDRTYRTIVRFIEYQPEAERPELEEMLRDFAGREEELCDLLSETYGEDFDMLKAACYRGPSMPLLANGTNDDPTARTLLLADVPMQQQQQHEQQPFQGGESDGEDAYNSGGDDYVEDEQSDVTPVEEHNDDDGDYVESSQPYSTPRVEEGDYDEEPVYDEDNYARELLTPAVPYERR